MTSSTTKIEPATAGLSRMKRRNERIYAYLIRGSTTA
jgi:hypothetical protein